MESSTLTYLTNKTNRLHQRWDENAVEVKLLEESVLEEERIGREETD